MNHVIKACKDILDDHYGHQFQGLILFGPVARNRDAETSDLDLLVLLGPPFDYFVELRNPRPSAANLEYFRAPRLSSHLTIRLQEKLAMAEFRWKTLDF